MTTTPKLYTQDNYETEMTAAVLTSSGDIQVSVRVAPTYSRGYVFLGASSNPEVAYFYNVIGTTLYIAGPSRTNASAHAVGEPVTISNCAALINRLEENAITTHSCEITGMLTVNILGGYYSLSGVITLSADTAFTLLDNTTTYIYLSYNDNSLKKGYILADINNTANAEYGQVVSTIITAGGKITSVLQNTVKNYIDYNDINLGGVNTNTPTLVLSYISTLANDTIDTGAQMAIHNTSDSVDKKVTIQDIFTHAQASGYINPGFIGYSHTQASAASTWTVAHNLNSSNIVFQCFDNSSPAETLIPDTVTRNLNSLVLTFAGHTYAGTCVVGTPYGTATANNQPSIDFIAGEDIGTAKMVRMGITGRESGIQASYIPSPVTSTFDTVSSTKTLYQTFKAQRATAIAVQLYAKKTAAPDTTSMTVEIYATTTQTISSQIYNVPTGSALGTSTIASGSLSTAAAYVTATLTVPITTLTPGNYYAIKIVGVGAENVNIGYGDDGVNYNTNGFQFISSLVPITGDFAYKVQHAAVASEVTSKVYLASSFETVTGVIIGASKALATAGNTVRVETHIATAFTSLSEGLQYYLSDIAGEISLTVGTHSITAGIPLSTTSLIIR